jgi:DDE superfamily endonuclease
MEDVLDVYERPVDARRPVIGFDEKPGQLIRHVLQPVAPRPGQLKRQDSEYARCGTAHLFGWVEPLSGRRDVWVTDQRNSVDYAHALERLAHAYPSAAVIVVVQDHLSTHTKAALYQAFPPEYARRLAARFEFHFTPRHGSWLNIQELEWAALAKRALAERVGDQAALEQVTAHWLEQRRTRAVTIRWQCRTPDARLKLSRLCPVFSA